MLFKYVLPPVFYNKDPKTFFSSSISLLLSESLKYKGRHIAKKYNLPELTEKSVEVKNNKNALDCQEKCETEEREKATIQRKICCKGTFTVLNATHEKTS